MLLSKYDKKCHLYINCALQNKSDIDCQLKLDNRDEFLAGIIGELIRMYSKSNTLSKHLCSFQILTHLSTLMKDEQFVISSNAQKTFETILRGNRLKKNPDKLDQFVRWIDQNSEDGSNTHEQLNEMFFEMRQSDCYAFKRYSMKIQYEILFTALKQCMIDNSARGLGDSDSDIICNEEDNYLNLNYYRFSKYFVDNKYNLKDIMVQISTLNDDTE